MSEYIKFNYAPQFLQKKRFPRDASNSYRVLFEDAYNWGCMPDSDIKKVPDYFTPVASKIPDTQTTLYPKRDLRHHNPQPQHCNFLLNNARTLNAPQCFVKTHKIDDDNNENWFNYTVTKKDDVEVKYSTDSTSRSDYLNWKSNAINTRHSHNPHMKIVADNIISDSGKEREGPRYWNEGLSFEHQYNSRVDPNYPIRGKRHGAFVWSRNNCPIDGSIMTQRNEPYDDNNAAAKLKNAEFQHKLACHRQFAPGRQLGDNVDSVSRLIRPDIDERQHTTLIFTH